MIIATVLVISTLLQYLAAILAVRLIWTTGARVPWVLIAAAASFMAVRRSITLTRLIMQDTARFPDLSAELVALAISLLMVAGVRWIGPSFIAIREREKRTQQLADQNEAVAEVGRILSSTLDIDQVYERFAQALGNLVPIDRIAISIIDYQNDTFTPVYVSGIDVPEHGQGNAVTLSGSATAEALRTRSTLLIEVDTEEELQTGFPSLVLGFQAGFRSFLLTPLISKGRVIGVLNLRCGRVGVCGNREMAIIERLASQIAPAVENAQLYEEVKTGSEELQALTHQLVVVQEAERRHLAAELHDEIGQVLTGIKLNLELSQRLPVEGLKANLFESQKLISELLGRVRDLSLDLRPAMLDDLGLLPALRWHFERYTAQTHVRVNFHHHGMTGRFEPEVETAVFRIVQEGLTNVARHAGVDEATVRLSTDDDTFRIVVEDQGTGFDPGSRLAANSGSGIIGMRQRAVSLRGQLLVESIPGKGARLTATFPVESKSVAVP